MNISVFLCARSLRVASRELSWFRDASISGECPSLQRAALIRRKNLLITKRIEICSLYHANVNLALFFHSSYFNIVEWTAADTLQAADYSMESLLVERTRPLLRCDLRALLDFGYFSLEILVEFVSQSSLGNTVYQIH